MQFTKKRVAVVAASSIAALSAAGVGYAYWNASAVDTGSNTATNASKSAVQIVVDSAPAGLYPGGTGTLKFHLKNESSTVPAYLGSTTFSVDAANVAVDASDATHSGCTAALAALSGSTTATPGELAGAAEQAANTYSMTVTMADFTAGDAATGHNSGDQSACAGAKLVIPVKAG